MGTAESALERLRRANEAIEGIDPEIAVEGRDYAAAQPKAVASIDAQLEQESIVMRRLRPVLAVRDGEASLTFADQADSDIWKQRLSDAQPLIKTASSAVGRINLEGAGIDWVGTGWLVRDNILVTNRHVAREFAGRDGDGFSFQMGEEGPMTAATDFLQEIDVDATRIFKLVRPLHIEDQSGPDVAFFEIEQTSGDDRLAAPLTLCKRPRLTAQAAVIGYPAYDSRIPEPDLMERIYGRVYNKKRLAPGAVTEIGDLRLLHNCTTLGGNSGSALIDLDTGEALGLHFSGAFLTTNYAVRADVVASLLEEVLRRPRSQPARRQRTSESAPATAFHTSVRSAQLMIPLTISVMVGDPVPATPGSPSGQALPPEAEDAIEGIEGRVEDYADRTGYQPGFLGAEVALPQVIDAAADVLRFGATTTETELKYQHFSVVMSRLRRMCFFSACNIDGGLSKKSGRVGWKWDPRIDRRFQIMNECYGNPPRFSRGHMTRREDPGWGDEAQSRLGNEDSMHVCNATPQMQAFNSPIWLALEDHALQHARQDAMRISVFTGPYFTPDDPMMYGVRIPLSFWKVIAFIHDETGRLCATGYEMNQSKSLLPQEEYVFGAFTSPQLGIATQVSIASIQAKSGLDFDVLQSVDPLGRSRDEGRGGGEQDALLSLDQIRFSV